MNRRSPTLLVLVGLALASCKSSGSGPADATVNDAPAEAIDASDASSQDGACAPDDAPFDAGTCIVDSAAPEDASSEDAPFCCTEELCAAIGLVCDASTCRCDRAPCDTPGGFCDAGAIPGVKGTLACVAADGGAYCAPVVQDPRDCPPGAPWCVDTDGGCLCGVGCQVFRHECPDDQWCVLIGYAYDQSSTGWCQPRWTSTPEGAQCTQSPECGDLACVLTPPRYNPVCTRVDCGLSAGAPACPAGTFCDVVDRYSQMGVCRTPCNRWDETTPCAPDEICAPYASGGACLKVGVASLPRAGDPCADNGAVGDFCAPGLLCISGTCVKACDPHASSPAAPGACPAGLDCVPALDAGVCAKPCNPFLAAPASECSAGLGCHAEVTPCGSVAGYCLPFVPYVAQRGERCWGQDACAAGLACSGGVSPRCLPICRPGAKACEMGACGAGEHCFALVAPDSPTRIGYGVCSRPCAPGGTDCAESEWCEPFELDPATNRWIGMCQ